MWYGKIKTSIYAANVVALQNSSRLPEVVEWYYQQQAEVMKETSFLEHEMAFDLVYTLPSITVKSDASDIKTSRILVSVSDTILVTLALT